MEILISMLPFVPIVVVVVALIILIASGYVKAPPDQAYIISGWHKKPRILVGKAGVKIPFLERLDKLSLGAIQIDVPRFLLRSISMLKLILLCPLRSAKTQRVLY